MLGQKKGLKAKVHNVAPHIRFTHCIIHREALACKAIVTELKTVFDTAVKLVNYMKSPPLNARLFASLCKDMGSDHEALLLHTKIRWLSGEKFSHGSPNTNILSLFDKINAFSKKLERWISRAEEGNIEMFPDLKRLERKMSYV
ncbi:zinc finger BED domain-containing protein 5-like [Macrobrachium nipponense]|uniref:zinc finger BED domain-containing protein 5-like n=1 Tax=Macrobrachium nipponense TaxID=159736 RepID=UPI0030C89CE6